MKTSDIVFEGVYHGNDERNTRLVTALFDDRLGRNSVEYEPTGNQKTPAWRARDGRCKMTLAAFARWAKGRVK